MAKQREIERVLSKYRERRLAESGGPLELHRAARERLFDAVEEQFGTDMSAVPAADNAEQFAKTLAWQSGMGRWWHRLIPQIGMAGTFAVALLVIFMSMNRSGDDSRQARQVAPESAPATTKDFLGGSTDSTTVGSAATAGAVAPDRDSEGARQIIMEPQVDDTILTDTTRTEAPIRAPAAPSPTATPKPRPERKVMAKVSVESLTAPAPVPAPSFTNPTVAPAETESMKSFSSTPSPARDVGRAAPAPRPAAMRMAGADTAAVEPAGPAKKLRATPAELITVVLPPARPMPKKSVVSSDIARPGVKSPVGNANPVVRTTPLTAPTSLSVPAFEPAIPAPPTRSAGRAAVGSSPVPMPTVMAPTPAARDASRSVSGPPITTQPTSVASTTASAITSDLRQTFEQSGAAGQYRRTFNSPPRQTPLKRFDLLVKGTTVTIRDSDGSIYNGQVQAMPSNADGSFAFEVKGTHRATRQSLSFKGRYVAVMPSSAAASSAFYTRGNASRGARTTSSTKSSVIGQVVLAGRHKVDVNAAAKP